MSESTRCEQRDARPGAPQRAILLALAGIAALVAALTVSSAALPARALAATYTQEIDLSTCTQNLVISAGGTYRLYGSTAQWGVVVNTADAVYITLDNASIGSDTMAQAAFSCGGNTTLYLKGTNTMECGGGSIGDHNSSACLDLGPGDNVTIDLAPDQTAAEATLSVHNSRVVGGSGIGCTVPDAQGTSQCRSTLTINGGTVAAYGAGCAGIACYDWDDGPIATITINGGTVSSYGSTSGYGGPGIGSDAYSKVSAGVITINGGTVTAVGSDGCAGIGSGLDADGLAAPNGGYGLTITGGSVTAQGGSDAAGIGGGCESDCGGPILISGGDVTAIGGQYGAGIGGGEEGALGGGGEGGEVHITGGNVVAVGNEYGAGIGGGKGGQAGATYISGGVVVARGGDKAAGIGGGYAGNTTKDGAAITISGGTVTAYGATGGAGIGGGCENGVGTGGKGGPVIITGGSVKASGGGSGTQAIGHGKGDPDSGTLTNGYGDTVTLTQRAGMFDAISPVSVNLVQHITTVHASYDYRYSGAGHAAGDTCIYVYLPVGVAFQPVTALLGALKTEPPVAGLSPRLRTWLVDRLQAAKSAYEHNRYRETIAQLGSVRNKVLAESGKGIPVDTATRWIYILDLIIKQVETR